MKKRKKCHFGQDQVRYLGHLVPAAGIAPLLSRVQALEEFPPPSTKLGLQRYLGMLNYYRRFVPRLATMLAPLHAALAGGKKNKSLVWSPECTAAFQSSKWALAQASLLRHPSSSAPTALHVDASNAAIGAELAQQSPGGTWKPIAFFSKTLAPAEKKYSAFDRELLAIYSSIKHFCHFLKGHPFTVFTDHKPLTFALASSTDRSPRQTNHLSYITEFTSVIRHVKGEENVVANALSRPEIASVRLPSLDYAAFTTSQDTSDAKDTSLHVSCVQ